MYQRFTRMIAILALFFLALSCPALAADSDESVYCLSETDFPQSLCGIFLTGVPESDVTIRCGARTLQAGDALDQSRLQDLKLTTAAQADTVAALTYLPIFAEGPGEEQTLYISLKGTKNEPPTAADSQLSTYKNMALTGTLRGEDPEGDDLLFLLETEPRRGTVSLQEDGSFTYTPDKNKVGRDTFTYCCEDTQGNRSAPAKVTVAIQKVTSRELFADMVGDAQEYEATFLKEAGIFSGELVGGVRCFCPDREVTAGEFLLMTMKLTGLAPEETASGSWFTPWQTAALRAGITCPEDPSAAITRSDAAVLLAGTLDLPVPDSVTVFSDQARYVRAASLQAVEDAGLPCLSDQPEAVLTRRDAAMLLCSVNTYCAVNSVTFPWQS